MLHGLDRRSNRRLKREIEWRAAVMYLAANPRASRPELAQHAGVSVRTIASWKKQPRFVAEVTNWRQREEENADLPRTPIP
jgi:hypothetical protein